MDRNDQHNLLDCGSSSQSLTRDEEIRSILERQIKSEPLSKKEFIDAMEKLGLSHELAVNRYEKATEFRIRFADALAKDLAELQAEATIRAAMSILVEITDKIQKSLREIGATFDRAKEVQSIFALAWDDFQRGVEFQGYGDPVIANAREQLAELAYQMAVPKGRFEKVFFRTRRVARKRSTER